MRLPTFHRPSSMVPSLAKHMSGWNKLVGAPTNRYESVPCRMFADAHAKNVLSDTAGGTCWISSA